MNAMAISVGRARRIAVRASRPPADAPIATTGISGDALLGDGLCTWEEGIRHRDPSGNIVHRNSLALTFCSRSELSKCTPPLKFEPYISVANAFRADDLAL